MFIILNLVGGLGIFLFGMKTMSDGIQKRAGERLHRLLHVVTANPLAAIITGLTVTSLIQSSSATTVMLVSLVNAQLMNLSQAIGVIMGANIGTTLTAWIVSFFGFKIKITSFALPAIALSLPLHFSKRDSLRDFSSILLGFGLLFLGLYEMKESVAVVQENAGALQFLSTISGFGYGSILLFVLIGTIITIVVQSSSAAMTITLTLAFNGWIPFEVAAAIVLGENIGTTITAYLASLEMSTGAKRTARAHMVFNMIGIAWMLVLFYPMLSLVDILVPGVATDPLAMPFHLSAFHSIFNLVNTSVLVWFIPAIEKLVIRLVPEPAEGTEADIFYLPKIRPDLVDQAEINLINGRTAVGTMSRMVNEMMLILLNGFQAGVEQITGIEEDLRGREEQLDDVQEELSTFLAECSMSGLTEGQSHDLRRLLRIVNELESISDACYMVSRLYLRKRKKGLSFHENASVEIGEYAMNVADFLTYNTDFLNSRIETQEYEIAAEMEKGINKQRKALTKLSRKTIKKGGNLQGELLYMEIIRHLEHIGDFCLNISQAINSNAED